MSDIERVGRNQDADVTGWVGWAIFAGVMMVLLGTFHIIDGLIALFNDQYFLVARSGLTVHADFTVWGWVHLIGGDIIIAAGVGVFSGQVWARTSCRRRHGQCAREHRLPLGVPDLVDDHDRDRHHGDLGADRARGRAARRVGVLTFPGRCPARQARSPCGQRTTHEEITMTDATPRPPERRALSQLRDPAGGRSRRDTHRPRDPARGPGGHPARPAAHGGDGVAARRLLHPGDRGHPLPADRQPQASREAAAQAARRWTR